MGTVFTIDIRDPGDWDAAIREAAGWLHRIDRVFSTYWADSDISRLRAGTLGPDGAHPSVAPVLGLCATLERETEGWFSARFRGGIDPTGLVKGWAIERASDILRSHGSRNHGVNGGGDLQLAGEASPGQPWRIGISDPRDPGAVAFTLQGRDFAVATSGTSERGPHILNPFTGQPADDLLSVTVTGPSLTRADAYATAAFAMGRQATAWLAGRGVYSGRVIC